MPMSRQVSNTSTPLGPTSPYLLQPLLRDIELGGDDSAGDNGGGAWITCLEVWGTSAGDLFQIVRIPPDPLDPDSEPIFIPATRLKPDVVEVRKTGGPEPGMSSSTTQSFSTSPPSPGVQKILLLSDIKLAVVICNSSLNFYTLPELSPAFEKFKTFTCTWVEQIERSLFTQEIPVDATSSAVIVMSLKQKIRRVLLDSEQPRRMGDIEFGGSVAMVSRGRVACVADSESYALVDLVGSQKIPLFAISPERERHEKEAAAQAAAAVAATATAVPTLTSRSTTGTNTPSSVSSSSKHLRSSSLGVTLSSGGRFQFDLPESLRQGAAAAAGMALEGRARAVSAVTGTARAKMSTPSSKPEGSPPLGVETPVAAESGDTQTQGETEPALPVAKDGLQKDEVGVVGSPKTVAFPNMPLEGQKSPLSVPSPTTATIKVTAVPKVEAKQRPKQVIERLQPHIVSPNSSEFLLTTGTTRLEQAMGMFVNMDGDATRGTLEFCAYPDYLVVDSIRQGEGFGRDDEPEGGYALAIIRSYLGSSSSSASSSSGSAVSEADDDDDDGDNAKNGDGRDIGFFLEIQRWDVDPGEESKDRRLYDLSSLGVAPLDRLGVQKVHKLHEMQVPEVIELLTKVPFYPNVPKSGHHSSRKNDPSQDAKERDREEERTAREKSRIEQERTLTTRLASISTNVICWAGNSLFWAVQNHHLVRLNARLDEIGDRIFSNSGRSSATSLSSSPPPPQHLSILGVLRVIPEHARSELDVYSSAFLGQKAALLLFVDLLVHAIHTHEEADVAFSPQDLEKVNAALLAHMLDVRVVLSLIPGVRDEIQCRDGVWMYSGLRVVVERAVVALGLDRSPDRKRLDRVLPLLRLYLQSWRQKKGFGSVEDGEAVFSTVDIALVRVLLSLEADAKLTSGNALNPVSVSAASADLLCLLGDSQFDSVDLVEPLLRSHNRIDLLAHVFQAKGMHSQVLECWQQVMSQPDGSIIFPDGESQMHAYLATLSDRALVERYGVWLATRNPKMGVSVLVSESGRIKFSPEKAVELIRKGAPNAVRDLLDILVFSKKINRYAPELVDFYLDNVLERLDESEESRDLLAATYETYRALVPPKPSYRHFLAENSIPDRGGGGSGGWAHHRLRLLRLLNSTAGSLLPEDTERIAAKLERHKDSLLPEMMMIHSVRRNHRPALKLLVGGLADFGGAVRYCLAGGGVGWRYGGGGGGGIGTAGIAGSVGDGDGSVVPASREEQEKLFGLLLEELFEIPDEEERVVRTAELLQRFGGWFRIEHVVPLIPKSWPLAPFVDFFIGAVRRLVRERAEVAISSELWKSERLRSEGELVECKEREVSATEGGGGE